MSGTTAGYMCIPLWLVHVSEILRWTLWVMRQGKNAQMFDCTLDYLRSEGYPSCDLFDVLTLLGAATRPEANSDDSAVHLSSTAIRRARRYYSVQCDVIRSTKYTA